MSAFDPASREREAMAEMGATRISAPLCTTLLVTFVAPMALFLAFELVRFTQDRSEIAHTIQSPAKRDSSSLWGWNQVMQERFGEIEKSFDERSALARTLRPWTQLVLTHAFRFGNEQVYLGSSGTLQFRDDFDLQVLRRPGNLSAPEATAQQLRELKIELARKGVALLVIPVPSRAGFVPKESVNSRLPYPRPSLRHRALLEALSRASVPFFDPTPTLTQLASLDSPFLSTDTHWTPEAVDRVSREVALRLRESVDLPPGVPDQFQETPLTARAAGDLVHLLGLPPRVRDRWQEEVSLKAVQRRPSDDNTAPVLVCGDSFAAVFSVSHLRFGSDAGFSERLAFHLGLPVESLVEVAGRPERLLAKLALRLEEQPPGSASLRAIVLVAAVRNLA